MKVFFLVVGMWVSLGVQAQHLERIDSLKKQLPIQSDVDKINTLYEIAWEYRNSIPDSTILYAKRSLEIARENNVLNAQAKAYNFIGIAYHYKGDYVNSFDFLSKALRFSIELQDSVQYGHALNTLGRLFMNQGDLVKSYNYFLEAKEVFQKLDDVQGMSYSYKSLAELYKDQNNLPKALEMLELALEIRHKTEDERGEISVHNEIAQLYRRVYNYEKAFQYYLHAKTIASRIGDDVSIAEINIGIASIYYDRAKYSEALIFCEQAREIVDKIDNDDLRSRVYLQLGKTHLAIKNFQIAEEYLLEVVSLGEEAGNKHVQMEAYYQLHLKSEKENDISKAYQHFQKYFELKTSLDDANKARVIERMEARLEIENKQRENELLLAKQSRDQAIIRQQQIEKLALFILAIVITGFMINLWITAKRRRKANLKLERQKRRIATQKSEIIKQNEQINLQNADLHVRNEELAELNEEKDNLMNIMAHDLKGPFNRVVGLVELIKMTTPENHDSRKYLEMMKDVSLSGISLIRDLLDVHAFEADKSSMKYERINLEEFINRRMDEFRSEIEAKNLNVKIAVAPINSPFYTDEVYLSRILDNLISNAVKFSHPDGMIDVQVENSKNILKISILDNGQGFSDEDKRNLYQKFKRLSARPTGGESSNGLGLAIVKLLVDHLGGEIELKSEKNKGSEFILRFPLKQHSSVGSIA